jgi:hypothetical protein
MNTLSWGSNAKTLKNVCKIRVPNFKNLNLQDIGMNDLKLKFRAVSVSHKKFDSYEIWESIGFAIIVLLMT